MSVMIHSSCSEPNWRSREEPTRGGARQGGFRNRVRACHYLTCASSAGRAGSAHSTLVPGCSNTGLPEHELGTCWKERHHVECQVKQPAGCSRTPLGACKRFMSVAGGQQLPLTAATTGAQQPSEVAQPLATTSAVLSGSWQGPAARVHCSRTRRAQVRK